MGIETARMRTKPLPPFTGEGWDGGHPKSRVRARSPFPRLRGKAGMGAFRHSHPTPRLATARRPPPNLPPLRRGRSVECIGSRAYAHKTPSPACGGRLGWGPSEAARQRTNPLPPFTGEGWDGGTRHSHPTPRLATARCPPPNLPPLRKGRSASAHPKSRQRTQPLPPFTGEGWDGGHPKSRVRARSPFPRLRGKAGMGAFRHSHPTPRLATARCPPPNLPPLRRGRGFARRCALVDAPPNLFALSRREECQAHPKQCASARNSRPVQPRIMSPCAIL
jgi:hypothetical protein